MRRATKSPHVRASKLKNRGATLDRSRRRAADVARLDPGVPLKALHGNLEDELEMLRDLDGRLYDGDS